jgi:hypothetical protein
MAFEVFWKLILDLPTPPSTDPFDQEIILALHEQIVSSDIDQDY